MTSPLSPEAVAQMVDSLRDRRASWLGDGSSPDKLCAAAADMITTLAAENATLRTQLAERDATCERLREGEANLSRLLNENARAEFAEAELATLRASEAAALERVKVLEAALKPFANAADARKRKGIMGGVCFVQSHLLAARQALTPTADKEPS